jgi:hypothetical protein
VVAGAEIGMDQRRRGAQRPRGARQCLARLAQEQAILRRDAVGMGRHLALEDVDVARREEITQMIVGAAVAQPDLEDRATQRSTAGFRN